MLKLIRGVGIAGGMLLMAFWIVIMPHSPVGVPMEVTRMQVPCGELLLTQTFTGTSEPYFVWLFHRSAPGADWTQYWVDDEAPYWWGGLGRKNQTTVLELYGSSIGTFDCVGPRFQLRGRAIAAARTVVDPFDIAQTQGRRLP